MKKITGLSAQKPQPPAKRGAGYPKLVKAITQVNTGMVIRSAVAVNQALVLRNWLIGAYIVEFEQNGAAPGEVWGAAAGDAGCGPEGTGHQRAGNQDALELQSVLFALSPNPAVGRYRFFGRSFGSGDSANSVC